MTEVYYQAAQELARKAIGWRAEAQHERMKREQLEREHGRSTWRALERLRPQEPALGQIYDDAFAEPYAWLRATLKAQPAPLTMEEAAAILRELGKRMLDALTRAPLAEDALQLDCSRWPAAREALGEGSFIDWQTWWALREALSPPPLVRAMLDLVMDVAPMREESDPNLELHER